MVGLEGRWLKIAGLLKIMGVSLCGSVFSVWRAGSALPIPEAALVGIWCFPTGLRPAMGAFRIVVRHGEYDGRHSELEYGGGEEPRSVNKAMRFFVALLLRMANDQNNMVNYYHQGRVFHSSNPKALGQLLEGRKKASPMNRFSHH